MNAILLKRTGGLIAAVLLAAGCNASSSDTKNGRDATAIGTITGTVLNTATPPAGIAGVAVKAVGADAPAAITDSKGKFTLPVIAGTYTVQFTGDNLDDASQSGVAVAMGQTTTLPDQVMQKSALTVTVVLPDDFKYQGPTGFDTDLSGITVKATLNGADVAPDSVDWSIKDYDGVLSPPTPVTLATAGDGSVGFHVPGFDAVVAGANTWMSNRYGRYGDDAFKYIQVQDRIVGTKRANALVSFGTQQVRAMSYKVIARVRTGTSTATGSAVVSPVAISNGGNMLPKGMMVVANAAKLTSGTYTWTMRYLPPTAITAAEWVDATSQLREANTKNPYFVPTTTGLYELTQGTSPNADAPIYFRVSTYHGTGKDSEAPGADGVTCKSCHSYYSLDDKFAEWAASAHGDHFWYEKDPNQPPMPLFKFGITGGDGQGYKENCIACHVVGYSKIKSADNGGWDDEAKKAGWTFPATDSPAAWNTVVAGTQYADDGVTVTKDSALLHRASIQCENCHGPLNPAEHSQRHPEGDNAPDMDWMKDYPISPVASMDAGVCLVCHDALTHHDRGSLWASSKHADTALALADGTVEGRPTSYNANSGVSGAPHCARCHSGEGFTVYLDQLSGGCSNVTALDQRAAYIRIKNDDGTCTAIDGTNTAAADTFLKGKGLTVGSAHSQTCQTCHDPHSTELRVEDDTRVTAASFEVKNSGSGALCIVCHNSRIGAAFYSNSEITKWTAPHVAAQGDIFAGRNAFFYGKAKPGTENLAVDGPDLPDLNIHQKSAANPTGVIENACADCHVRFTSPDVQAQYQVYNTNHTFIATKAICAECHGEGMGEKIAQGVEEKMATLYDRLGTVFRERLNRNGADMGHRYNVTVDKVTGAVTGIGETKTAATGTEFNIKKGTVQSVLVFEFHGNPAVVVTLNDGTTFGETLTSTTTGSSLNYTFRTPGSSPGSTTDLFAIDKTAGNTPKMKILAEATYNYMLIHGGAAEGMHNPNFTNAVLDATLTTLPAGYTVE